MVTGFLNAFLSSCRTYKGKTLQIKYEDIEHYTREREHFLLDGDMEQRLHSEEKLYRCMGESFQDYSWIQDFEADFPLKKLLLKKVSRRQQ